MGTMLSLLVSISLIAQPSERDAVLKTMQAFFDTMTARDVEGAREILQPQGRFAFAHLLADAFGACRVECGLLTQLVWREHRQQLSLGDLIALVDHQVADAPADLRADDDVMRSHDAGEDQRLRKCLQVDVVADGAEHEQQDDEANRFFHGAVKHMYKTIV